MIDQSQGTCGSKSLKTRTVIINKISCGMLVQYISNIEKLPTMEDLFFLDRGFELALF